MPSIGIGKRFDNDKRLSSCRAAHCRDRNAACRAARGLNVIVQDSSHLVGFFCDTPMVGSGYFGMLQMGVMARCRKAHCELVIKAFDNSQSITTAMVQRGYDGDMPMLLHKPFERAEVAFSLLFVAAMGILRVI